MGTNKNVNFKTIKALKMKFKINLCMESIFSKQYVYNLKLFDTPYENFCCFNYWTYCIFLTVN